MNPTFTFYRVAYKFNSFTHLATSMFEEPRSELSAKEVAEVTLKTVKEIPEIKDAPIEARIAAAIEYDISDRSGFKLIWLNCTPEMRFHIVEVWSEIVRQELATQEASLAEIKIRPDPYGE